MEFDVLTLYPEMFAATLNTSILGRAQEKGLLRVRVHQIRDFALDKHHSVDHSPYGGGAGMVMRADVLKNAWEHAKLQSPKSTRTILLSAQGQPFSQAKAEAIARGESGERLILVCGRFEGVDERFIEAYVDEEISVGDYVLTGGELPAMVVIDAAARLLPGVVGNADSVVSESFGGEERLLEYPQYTQPREFEGRAVPEVLLSGDHKKIAAWRKSQAQNRTEDRRPDLISRKGRRP